MRKSLVSFFMTHTVEVCTGQVAQSTCLPFANDS